MKVAEALKRIKALREKASDLRKKVQTISAHMSSQKTDYDKPKEQVATWIQMHTDTVSELGILLRQLVQTNLKTQVSISIKDKVKTMSLLDWNYRRKELNQLDQLMQAMLTNKNLRIQVIKPDPKDSSKDIPDQVVLNFDPVERDNRMDYLREEIVQINSSLETVNATTDLIV